jgi:hypothetical protein
MPIQVNADPIGTVLTRSCVKTVASVALPTEPPEELEPELLLEDELLPDDEPELLDEEEDELPLEELLEVVPPDDELLDELELLLDDEELELVVPRGPPEPLLPQAARVAQNSAVPKSFIAFMPTSPFTKTRFTPKPGQECPGKGGKTTGGNSISYNKYCQVIGTYYFL